MPNEDLLDLTISELAPLIKAREVSPVDLTEAAISNGFTDSRFTRPLGVTTYGFSGSHPDDDPMLSHVHGTDESVGIRSLVSGTKIMLAVAIDLLAAR